MRQIGRLLRRPPRGEIARRSGNDKAVGGDAPHDQAGIRHRHVADSEIEPLLHQIDHPVGHRQVDRHLGIKGHELGDHGRKQWRNGDRRIEAQRTARGPLQSLGNLIGILYVRQNLQAALVVGMADFGQAHTPGAAVEEPDTEPLLERLNVGRDHAWRHAQRPRRRGKAAALDHLHEGGHAGHAVHVLRNHSVRRRHVPALCPYQVACDHVCSRLRQA